MKENSIMAKGNHHELGEGEFLDPKTGLIHCTVCREPRQTVQRLLGRTYYPRILCICEKAAIEAHEAELVTKDTDAKTRRLQAAALQSKILPKYRFEKDRGYNSQKIAIAKAYIANWPDKYSNGEGLLFFGRTGAGKSFIAGCIGNALIDTHVSVLMMDCNGLDKKIGSYSYSEQGKLLDSINRFDLLIIDDLGVGLKREYTVDLVSKIISDRYNCGKPLIVTTNLDLSEMKDEKDDALSRIYSRVLERCVAVKVEDTNIRENNRKERLAIAKDKNRSM